MARVLVCLVPSSRSDRHLVHTASFADVMNPCRLVSEGGTNPPGLQSRP